MPLYYSRVPDRFSIIVHALDPGLVQVAPSVQPHDVPGPTPFVRGGGATRKRPVYVRVRDVAPARALYRFTFTHGRLSGTAVTS